jgi:hypothetical protein
VERWFLASTLFGTRISAVVAARTFAVLERAGLHRVTDAGRRTWEQLVALLDEGGYARYDFRTATRLLDLSAAVGDRYGGAAAEFGRRFTEPVPLVRALGELPGWGPVTIGLFLRELRGVWPGARLALDPRAAAAGAHLRLVGAGAADPLAAVQGLAAAAGLDPRDLESGLVRLSLRRRHPGACPGGPRCVALS